VGELLRFDLEDGGQVIVEVGEDEPGVVRASRAGDLLRDAAGSFESAMEGIRDAAKAALGKVADLPEPPAEVEIEFGVRFNAEAGAVIAKTGAEGHLLVTLTWKLPPPGGS
jgi:Trypsin-co-occurring domain 1